MTQTSTAFLTDFYELSMIQAALESNTADNKVTFELFARKLPEGRRYGVVGGMNRAIQAVKNFRFTTDQLEMLKQNPLFTPQTIEFFKNYKFKGTIHGYREGELYFPNSPIVTVQGTFADSVIIETVLLSILNHDSAVMSAASRMVLASQGMPLIEMGSRRTHEQSAVSASRAAYIAGFNATSNLQAAHEYNIPVTGTAAHAFTLSFATEKQAFEAQIKALGTNTTLLVDTYDIEQGIKTAIEVAGPNLGAIRIDSGDLHEETVAARKLLDELGATKTKIVLSSDIDEYTIAELLERGTPVDSVGAGTRVVTGSGHPTASMVYKIVERENEHGVMIPVEKNSMGKKSIGGFKTSYRTYSKDNVITDEFFTLNENLNNVAFNETTRKLQKIYAHNGEYFFDTVEESRQHHKQTLETLPSEAQSMIAGPAMFTCTENKGE